MVILKYFNIKVEIKAKINNCCFYVHLQFDNILIIKPKWSNVNVYSAPGDRNLKDSFKKMRNRLRAIFWIKCWKDLRIYHYVKVGKFHWTFLKIFFIYLCIIIFRGENTLSNKRLLNVFLWVKIIKWTSPLSPGTGFVLIMRRYDVICP